MGKTTDWVNQDGYRVGVRYAIWNPMVVFTFAGAMLLFFMIPWFWVGFVLMVIAYVAPLTAYIVHRNSKLEYHQKVMTAPHLRHLVADILGKLGVKIATEKQAAADKGPPVKFTPMGGANDAADQANLILARQSPGFVTAKEVIADVLDRRGDAVMLEYTATGASVKYQIDGVWHDLPPRERLTADPLLAVPRNSPAATRPNAAPSRKGSSAPSTKAASTTPRSSARASRPASARSCRWKTRNSPSRRSPSWACATS